MKKLFFLCDSPIHFVSAKADKGMEAAFAKAKVREVEPMKEITPVKKDAAPIAD